MTERENIAKIPMSFVLEMDDVGWDDGRDLRLLGQASRSELPRYHEYEDYEFIKLLSDRTGKSISLALCLGDWDKDNLLRDEVGISHNPFLWDRASEIDIEKMSRYRDVLNASRHDYIIHGILHGRYDENGNRKNEHEYFDTVKLNDGSRRYIFDEADFRRRLDIFMKLYNTWGFGEPPRAFINPCFVGRDFPEDLLLQMSKILYEYGVRYWIDPYFYTGKEVKVVNGIVLLCWGYNGGLISSRAYDVDPETLGDFYVPDSDGNSCVRGTHLTNFVRHNPKKNKEQVEPWANYLFKESEKFGAALANNLAEAANQYFYHMLAKISVADGVCEIDLSEVDAKKLDCHKNEFLINFKKEVAPKSIVGGEISFYEKHKEFNTYKVSHTDTRVAISF